VPLFTKQYNWYLASAFMLKAPYCGSGMGSNEQGGIVEWF